MSHFEGARNSLRWQSVVLVQLVFDSICAVDHMISLRRKVY